MPDSSEADTAQQFVNQTILLQLEKNSARLDMLEQSSCKKSVDESKIKNRKFNKSKTTCTIHSKY